MATTSIEPMNQSASSFIGLQSYTEAQSGSFFGRDGEITALTNLVKSNILTIVFGKSGTGKTSLLNAGVFPKLRKEYCLPFRIRLEFKEDSPDLIIQIKNVLKQEIDKYGFTVESYPGQETLWEYFHKEPLWKTITPILIFDQFEELFTLARNIPKFSTAATGTFWQEMSDIIENSIPEKLKEQFLNHKEQIKYKYHKQQSKILFAFREEFLPEFETLSSKIPSLKHSRFRLMPMNGHQALEVITKTWKKNISEREANKIVSYLTSKADTDSLDIITVEPSLLSQVCLFIDKERIAEGSSKVSAELLNKYPKETILRTIYEEAVNDANSKLHFETDPEQKEQKNYTKEFIEEKLITTEGYRTKHSLSEQDKMLQPAIDALKNKYFIREDDKSVELTHDVLTPLIKTDRENRRKQIALVEERRKARKKALKILLFTLLFAGGFWLVASYMSSRAVSQYTRANDSLKLINNEIRIKDSILHLKNGKEDTKQPIVPGKLEQKIKNIDSLLQLKNDTIRIIKNELRSLKDTIAVYKNILINKPDVPENIITQLSNQVIDLQKKVAETESRLNQIKTENEKLNEENLKLRKELEILRKELRQKNSLIDSLNNQLGNVSIKGKLYYGEQGNGLVKPANITMYLIPKEGNKKIVKEASVYEIDCYDKKLKEEATGVLVTRTDKNGNYVFRKVPKGEYLLKICTYYGGYYTVKMGDKKLLDQDFNASPPVPYPVSN